MIDDKEKSTRYEFRDSETRDVLGRPVSRKKPLKVGEEVGIADHYIYGNNSKKFRACVVSELEKDPCFDTIIAYVIVTGREDRFEGSFDGEKIFKNKKHGGEDSRLPFERFD